MAVAFDAQGHIDTAASTTATALSGTPITVGTGSNRAIAVCLAFGSAIGLPTSITVTCGGTAMAAVANATSAAGAVAASVLWFALVNPPSGTPTIAASWTGGRSCVMGAISVTGVDQTGGTTSFAHGAGNVSVSSTTASVTITSATGNMTVAAHADDGGVVINSTSATQDFIDMLGVGPGTAMNHTAGTASNVMTATLASTDDTANAGFDFVAAAAGVFTNFGFAPWSDPPKRKTFPAPEQPFIAFVKAAPFGEIVFEDRWHQPWSEPFIKTKTGLLVGRQQYLAYLESKTQGGTFAESVTADRWRQPWSDPVRRTTWHVQEQPFIALTPPQIAAAPVNISWLTPFSNPTRPKPSSITEEPHTPPKLGVQFDTQSTSDITGNAATSFSDNTKTTVGTGSKRAIVALITWGRGSGVGSQLPTNVSMTWAGQALTLVPNTARDDNNVAAVSIYALLNPTSGTQTFAGSWTGSADFTVSLVSLTNVDQQSFSTSFINGTTAQGASGTASVAVTSTFLDYTAGIFGTTGFFNTISNGTQVFIDNTPPNIGGAGLRNEGASSVTLGIGTSGNWAGAGCDIVFAAQPIAVILWEQWSDFALGAGRRSPAYSAPFFTQPLFPITATTPYAGWDDILEWPRPVQPRSPIYSAPFLAQTLGAFQGRDSPEDWTNWPDFAPKKSSAADLWPLAFVPIPPSATVIGDWPDFVRRKPQPLDTQPLSWTGQTIVTAAPVMPWTNWPDFAPKKPAPLNFTPQTLTQLAPQVWFPYGPWGDFARRKPQPLDTQPLAWDSIQIVTPITPAVTTGDQSSTGLIFPWRLIYRTKTEPVFVPPVVQVFLPYAPWDDFARRKLPPLNFTPATPFIQTPAQVFFPYGPWGDFASRQRPAIDTQRFAWSNFTPAASTFFLVPDRWADFAPKKPVPLNYVPLALVPTVQAPWTLWTQWPDRIWRKPPPVDAGPFTAFLQLVRVPWNELSRWPELVPIRTKAGLHAALQQFSARFPGIVTQATVTGILAAFEVNSDAAALAIYVRQSGPAVRAAVSIQEIGTI